MSKQIAFQLCGCLHVFLIQKSFSRCCIMLQELAKEAADYGLIYGLEVVNRYETNILNTAAQVQLHICPPSQYPGQPNRQLVKHADMHQAFH